MGRNEWKMKVEFIFLPLTLVSAQYGYAQPEFIGDLSNVLKEFRHSNSYPLMDGPRDSMSYPFDYEKRSDSSPAPIVPFNNLLKGGIRRLYLQRFGNARTNRW